MRFDRFPVVARLCAALGTVAVATSGTLLLADSVHRRAAAGEAATVRPPAAFTRLVVPRATSSAVSPSVVRTWITVRDDTRWTVSDGHVVARSRTLPTLVLRPSGPGRHPLVVFCHGFDITPKPYLHMLTHWAAAGFVVAAPYFPLTRADAGRWLDEADVDNQPRDVSVVITAVSRRLGSLVDRTRVVVAGHSDGGSTAFAVGFASHHHDARVDAVMVFSGDRRPSMGAFRAPARLLPLLQVQSDRDEFNSLSAAAQVWRVAHRPKFYLRLHGARHLPPFSVACRWRPIVEAVTTDFLRAWTTSIVVVRRRELALLDRDGARLGLSRVTDDR